jgi:ribosomal protein L37AE/L43A
MKKFQKRIQDFTCEVCGQKVKGSGYTNHCPNCLWSKHTDIFPGDRAEKCQGLMEPKYAIYQKSRWRIIHQCQKCGALKICNASPTDNPDLLVKLSTRPIPQSVLQKISP